MWGSRSKTAERSAPQNLSFSCYKIVTLFVALRSGSPSIERNVDMGNIDISLASFNCERSEIQWGEGPHIIWDQQQQLLQDFEAGAQRAQPEKDYGCDAFQTILYYVNAFGTSANLPKATRIFYEAKDVGHMIACVLELRLLDGLTQGPSDYQKEYSECLDLGFNIIGRSEEASSIDVRKGSSVIRLENYSSFRQTVVRKLI
ncbi:hypothetical protein N7447_010798 [Penicillium robsamsonii]|uniref:uncharacterized protein n=1 Tax=Penicillium robsamsonii TaxID=1792511 RepID=UPI0025476412|nr:uncharacterized protein N7447_010798 [Penicillium robsamsonii]KAJ5807342.1 hypothetical protein N7447_010798 [Penicillium robsamsonii]